MKVQKKPWRWHDFKRKVHGIWAHWALILRSLEAVYGERLGDRAEAVCCQPTLEVNFTCLWPIFWVAMGANSARPCGCGGLCNGLKGSELRRRSFVSWRLCCCVRWMAAQPQVIKRVQTAA